MTGQRAGGRKRKPQNKVKSEEGAINADIRMRWRDFFTKHAKAGANDDDNDENGDDDISDDGDDDDE